MYSLTRVRLVRRVVGRLPGLVYLRDPRVLQPGQNVSLALEPPQRLPARQTRPQRLERHQPSRKRLLGQIHNPPSLPLPARA